MAVRFFLICSRIPKSDVRKAKKDSSNANKKDVRTITQSEEQEKLLSDLLGGHKRRPNCVITVKFVLKLFQTYKIPIIFFIFAMTLPLLPSPKTMTNLQGCR